MGNVEQKCPLKIGILTFHRCVNNGAVMQAYSLSTRLRRELQHQNVTVEIIDYQMPCVDSYCMPSLRNYYRNCNPVLALKRTYRLLRNPGRFRQERKRIAVFEEAFKTLPLSEEKVYDDGCEKLFALINEKYDIVIAGSDAIWNFDVRGFPNPYFLSDEIKGLKYSYAASVYGMNYENIPAEQREKIATILDSYELLGARDEESIRFAAEMGCVSQPIHTCDPTVFLNVDNLPIDENELKEKLKSKGFDFSKPTIGMMGTDPMCEMLRRMYGRKYQIAALFNYCEKADCNLYDLTPFEWAYVFRLFKVTVTTFFHGTLVSLRNGTPVVCIALDNAYSRVHETKVEDFLKRVGMSEAYFRSDYRTGAVPEIRARIDYCMAHDLKQEIIDRMDQEAKTFDPFLKKLCEDIDKLRENDA